MRQLLCLRELARPGSKIAADGSLKMPERGRRFPVNLETPAGWMAYRQATWGARTSHDGGCFRARPALAKDTDAILGVLFWLACLCRRASGFLFSGRLLRCRGADR